jgi:hypothetical protein
VDCWSDEPPEAGIEASADARTEDLMFSYDMQFLPTAPGHHLGLRLVGASDAYVGGEIRYAPAHTVVGEGRVGAGLDLLGGGKLDLTLGLWIGAAGAWDRSVDAAVLYATPIAGTEIGFGYDGRRLFGRYRWLAGLGAEPLDSLLTENELTLGYKIVPQVHVYGQYLVLSPGEDDKDAGVGLGARLVF